MSGHESTDGRVAEVAVDPEASAGTCAPSAALTSKQRAVLDAVVAHVREDGYPPSMRQLAEGLGYSSVGSVHHHLTALQRLGYLEKAAHRPRALNVFPASDAVPEPHVLPEPRLVPLLGDIAAGVPIPAQELDRDLLPLPEEFVGRGEVFALRVRGDSMTGAAILDGDVVVVRRGATATNGQLVVGLLEGEATVKRLRVGSGGRWLEAANPHYGDVPFDQGDILGTVVSVLRRVV